MYAPNEDDRMRKKKEFWEQLGDAIEDVRGRLIIMRVLIDVSKRGTKKLEKQLVCVIQD